MNDFEVFRRSARSFSDLVKARKIHVCFTNTEDEARRICHQFNDNRKPYQISMGTKLEFTKE